MAKTRSYLEAPACIISTAQQARPKVMGQIEPALAQLTTVSNLDTTYSIEEGLMALRADIVAELI